MNYTKLTDQELILLIQSDPQAHFEALLYRYENQVFVYACRLLNYNQENAEDVCSEVWYKCYKSILAFNTKKKFISWVYQITHNQAIDYIRKHHKIQIQSIDKSSEAFFIESKSYSSEDKLIYIQHILQLLNPQDRSLLTLHYLEEKTVPEIAEIFSLLPKLISLKLFRAKRRAQKIAKLHYPTLIFD
ncbi:MAG: sigma-70 family RNA polymerase sigma factor [candidate division SR1 bacterium]|nr:sigma-70 family RNA polymerase sigma factor [candidate division SR1 bacterium]